MPRIPLLYTHEAPYHIVARSNNREWFYLAAPDAWKIFRCNLNTATQKFGFEIHAFVLMNNHYHLIGQCSEHHNLGEVMAWLQRTISREINKKTGHINHVFGGPYKASLIREIYHYSNVVKYVAQNPVKAGIASRAEDYPYSSFSKKNYAGNALMLTSSLKWGKLIPRDLNKRYLWLNNQFKDGEYDLLKEGLQKTIFQPKDRVSRTDPFMI